MSHRALRRLLISLWVTVVGAGLFLFVFHRDVVHDALSDATSASFMAASALYVVFGCLRGFTLLPSTTLVILAVPFFPPGWLFALTLIGILVSSTSIYFFADALHLDDVFAALHGSKLARLKVAMARYELSVIIAWSFFPLAPTDLICYASGILRVRFWKVLVGVALGEGAICAVYVFFGDWVLRVLHWRV